VWNWLLERRWALGFLAWSALAFTIAYWNHDENQRLDNAPTAPAVITDINRWTKGGPELELDIKLPDGRTVTGQTNNFNDVHRTGERILVQYALDGRDPNSYAGILWCFGKHDRPWFEREIFGTIRYMTSRSMAKKFNARRYMESV